METEVRDTPGTFVPKSQLRGLGFLKPSFQTKNRDNRLYFRAIYFGVECKTRAYINSGSELRSYLQHRTTSDWEICFERYRQQTVRTKENYSAVWRCKVFHTLYIESDFSIVQTNLYE